MTMLVIRNDELCPLGALEPPLTAAGPIAVWEAVSGPAPSLDGIDAVIALGGGTNPDEDRRCPWLAAERSLLGEAMSRQLPVLGVCLGGQLIAQVLGARTAPLPAPDIGWHVTPFTTAAGHDALFQALPSAPVLLEWHSHHFCLPSGATLLAGTGDSTEAFRHGDRTWALQFHLEADEQIVRRWIDAYAASLDQLGIDPGRLQQDSRQHAPVQAQIAGALATAFAHVSAASGAGAEAVR
jgi:GMP synthase-like glutamine amidotransferase